MEKFEFLIFLVLICLISLYLRKICIKNNFLLNYTGSEHQLFTKKNKVPLIGGVILFISLIFVRFNLNDYFVIFLSLFLLIGILSDLTYLKSAKLRFFIQLIILVIYVLVTETSIATIKFTLIDQLLEVQLFNYFFVIFCLMILINGTNFIDGCNTLVIGYYLIVSFILYKLNFLELILINDNNIFIFFSIFSSIFFLNFFEKLFLGDSGVYLLSFLFGVMVLGIYKINSSISPYFICNLLWYPSFEVLFSILRKFNVNFSVLNPDTNHLHQLIYFQIKKKFKKINSTYSNSLTSIIINFYHLLWFLNASRSYQDSKFQIFLLFISISIYCFLYIFFYKLKYKKL